MWPPSSQFATCLACICSGGAAPAAHRQGEVAAGQPTGPGRDLPRVRIRADHVRAGEGGAEREEATRCRARAAARQGAPLAPRLKARATARLHQRRLTPSQLRVHDPRHSCASLLIAQGVPLEIVKETLGHSQIGLTMNTYVHLLPETRRQAVDAMDRLFGAA